MSSDTPDGDALVAAILGRRSVGRIAPDPIPRERVEELLRAAVRAPNHHLTGPWRFVVIAGDARREIGEAHLRARLRAEPDLSPPAREKEANRLERAPVVIACCVHPGADPVEAREDRDAVAAGIQNLLLAARARGLATMWRTGTMVDEPEVLEALGLEDGDAVVGFVYLGLPRSTGGETPSPRPDPETLTVWRGW
jgi:nitroreductase